MRASPIFENFYHIYNRGTDKRRIFTSERDYERFLALLYLCNGTQAVHISNHQGQTLMELMEIEKGKPLVDIGAYCLMPNHFHILLKPKSEKGGSKFMQKLITAYTMYFNIRYERSGVLFQGRYKLRHADNDLYLKYLMAYIHLNPTALVTGSATPQHKPSRLADYPYSSYLDYAGTYRAQAKILSKEALPLYFSTPKDFVKEITDWLSIKV